MSYEDDRLRTDLEKAKQAWWDWETEMSDKDDRANQPEQKWSKSHAWKLWRFHSKLLNGLIGKLRDD